MQRNCRLCGGIGTLEGITFTSLLYKTIGLWGFFILICFQHFLVKKYLLRNGVRAKKCEMRLAINQLMM